RASPRSSRSACLRVRGSSRTRGKTPPHRRPGRCCRRMRQRGRARRTTSRPPDATSHGPWQARAIVSRMGRVVILLIVVAACGGAEIPQHNGYKSATAKPWKKAKQLKFDDKGEAKAEGDLSYGEMRRAAWFLADLPSNGDLDVRVEITPPGDA